MMLCSTAMLAKLGSWGPSRFETGGCLLRLRYELKVGSTAWKAAV